MKSTTPIGFGTYPCVVSDERLDELERRVARLEEELVVRRSSLVDVKQPPTTNNERRTLDLALIGRSLIAMGGAYLLRAATDLQVVPRTIGIALGLAYAVSWIVIGNRRTTVFNTAIGALIFFPIVWEATVRFHVLSLPLAIGLVVAGAVALLVVAARRNQQVVAWMASAGVIASATGLAFETRMISAPLMSVALVGAITWWLAERHGWRIVAWPTAIETDLLGIAAIGLVLLQVVHDDVATVIVALLVAFLAYTIVVRRSHVQSGAITAINLVAALILAQRYPMAGVLLPLAVVAGAFAMYARSKLSASALLMMLIGTGFLGQPGITWGLLAIAAAILSIRLQAAHLVYHAAAYAVAAAAGAGLLSSSARVFIGLGPGENPVTLTRAITFAAVAAATAIVIRSQVHIARMILIANATILAIGVIAYAGAELVGGEAARAAAVRTIVVGATAAGLAYLARLPNMANLGMLVYPLLIAGGVKMLIEDFRNGRPTTLFVTLAVYGVLLVIVARLRTRAGSDTPLPDTDPVP